MPLKKVLRDFVKVVNDEAERNPDFAERLRAVFESSAPKRTARTASDTPKADTIPRRAANRRSPAVLDPISIVNQGEETLRGKLAQLTLDQLKDIVAEYGMDPGKRVMKWKTPERVIDSIVETSSRRARKGDAFRT